MVAEVVVEKDSGGQGSNCVLQRNRVGEVARSEIQNQGSASPAGRLKREVLPGARAARAEVAALDLEVVDCQAGANCGHGSVEPGGARGQYTACIGKIAADVDCA